MTKSLYLFALLAALAPQVWAGPEATYGAGDQSTGRVGSLGAEPDNAFAAWSNPALLPLRPASDLALSSGYAVAELSARGDQGRQDFSPPTTRTPLWSLGYRTSTFGRPLQGRALGFGVALSGPMGNLRTFNAGYPQDAFSLRYGSADRQFQASPALGVEVIPDWLSFGVGVNLFLVAGGAAEVALASNRPESRMALDVALRAAPVLGLYGGNGDTGVSLVFRERIDPVFRQQFSGTVDVGGDTVVKQPVAVEASLYYEPRQWDLEAQHRFGLVAVSAGVVLQQWSQGKGPFLVTDAPDASGRVHRTELPALALQDTLSPRVSVQVPLWGDRFSFSSGYQYRPTPLVVERTEARALDSDVHVVGLALRHRIPEALGLAGGLYWAVSGQYHWLQDRDLGGGTRSPLRLSGRAYQAGLTVGAQW